MAYNPQNPLLNSLSLLFLIILTVMTQISIIAAREIPTTATNSGETNPEGLIDRYGSVLIPGVGKFMVPSLGGITGKIDDSQGVGGIIGPYIPGDESPLLSSTEFRASGPYIAAIPSPDPDPPSLSFDHPGVKISHSGSSSSTPNTPRFYHMVAEEPSDSTSSTSTLPSFYKRGVMNSEPATPSFYNRGVMNSEPATPSFYHLGVTVSEPATPSTSSTPPSPSF